MFFDCFDCSLYKTLHKKVESLFTKRDSITTTHLCYNQQLQVPNTITIIQLNIMWNL